MAASNLNILASIKLNLQIFCLETKHECSLGKKNKVLIFFWFFYENICCGYSLEAPCYTLLKKKKASNYHQITHLVCFSVFIINFADIKSNFPLSGPTCKGGQSPKKFLILISLESLGYYAIQNVSLRNRSALAVICWVINHCLAVSCKVDQITSAEDESFIYLQLTDKLWFITQQITHKSWSISILTHRKRRKSNCILQILPINFPSSHKEIPPTVLTVTLLFTCISYVNDTRKNDVRYSV